MTLGAKCSDEIVIACDGADEADAAAALKEFVEKYL